MGQQSLNIKNRLSILNKVQQELLASADNKYMKDHFLVKTSFNRDKVKHNFLIDYALCTKNCEVIDWVWYKIMGTMEDSKNYDFDMTIQQTNINIYNITNYIKEEYTWSEVQW